jgi:NADH-quinone oxidoreductase subunit N
VEAHQTWLAILGVVASLLSVFYYLRIVVYMYFREAVSDEPIVLPAGPMAALIFCAAAVMLFGILPSLVLDLTRLFF